MKEKKVQREVAIQCPVCWSSTYFALDLAGPELTCEDCGFLLADTERVKLLDSGRCIVCGNGRFYSDSFLSLRIFRRASRCYVCDSSYWGVSVNELDAKYVDEVADDLLESDAAKGLRQRAEHWH